MKAYCILKTDEMDKFLGKGNLLKLIQEEIEYVNSPVVNEIYI